MPVERARLTLAVGVVLLSAACTSGSPHNATASSAPNSPPSASALAPIPSVSNSAVAASPTAAVDPLQLPATYQQACATSGGTCQNDVTGRLPGALSRPMHLPKLHPGQVCPVTAGKRFDTALFGGVALGKGVVRPILVDQTGDDVHGIADMGPTSQPPWLAVKTLWFSTPPYQGPFVIRGERLDGPGPVGLGEGPVQAPLVVPPGPTVNGAQGYRTAPGGIWVKTPGCYGFQVDGLTFSTAFVIKAIKVVGSRHTWLDVCESARQLAHLRLCLCA